MTQGAPVFQGKPLPLGAPSAKGQPVRGAPCRTGHRQEGGTIEAGRYRATCSGSASQGRAIDHGRTKSPGPCSQAVPLKQGGKGQRSMGVPDAWGHVSRRHQQAGAILGRERQEVRATTSGSTTSLGAKVSGCASKQGPDSQDAPEHWGHPMYGAAPLSMGAWLWGPRRPSPEGAPVRKGQCSWGAPGMEGRHSGASSLGEYQGLRAREVSSDVMQHSW